VRNVESELRGRFPSFGYEKRNSCSFPLLQKKLGEKYEGNKAPTTHRCMYGPIHQWATTDVPCTIPSSHVYIGLFTRALKPCMLSRRFAVKPLGLRARAAAPVVVATPPPQRFLVSPGSPCRAARVPAFRLRPCPDAPMVDGSVLPAVRPRFFQVHTSNHRRARRRATHPLTYSLCPPHSGSCQAPSGKPCGQSALVQRHDAVLSRSP
jgi:hypothetical protein